MPRLYQLQILAAAADTPAATAQATAALAAAAPLPPAAVSSVAAPSIAQVDLSRLSLDGSEADRQLAEELSAAFSRTGFAVVTGHGVPSSIISALRASAHDFFGSTAEEKARVNANCDGQGYGSVPYVFMEENGAQLLGDFSQPNDVVESLTFRGLCTAHG